MSHGIRPLRRTVLPALLAAAALVPVGLHASSHREAPAITEKPKVDGTDFYMFRSYEPGREGFVTFVANYLPLQDPYGGPNYFTLDPRARYEIKIDNDGDAREDLTFRFRFKNDRRNIALADRARRQPEDGRGARDQRRPDQRLRHLGAQRDRELHARRRARLRLAARAQRRDRRDSLPEARRQHRQQVDAGLRGLRGGAPLRHPLPGCSDGRLFVGQRKDPFVVNLGETFDLVNVTNPLGPVDAEADDLADKNVTSLVLELPIACVEGSAGP